MKGRELWTDEQEAAERQRLADVAEHFGVKPEDLNETTMGPNWTEYSTPEKLAEVRNAKLSR